MKSDRLFSKPKVIVVVVIVVVVKQARVAFGEQEERIGWRKSD